VVVSDWTSKVIEHHLHFDIERPGYLIEYPKGHFTNRLVVDVEPQNAKDLLLAIKFKEQEAIEDIRKNINIG